MYGDIELSPNEQGYIIKGEDSTNFNNMGFEIRGNKFTTPERETVLLAEELAKAESNLRKGGDLDLESLKQLIASSEAKMNKMVAEDPGLKKQLMYQSFEKRLNALKKRLEPSAVKESLAETPSYSEVSTTLDEDALVADIRSAVNETVEAVSKEKTTEVTPTEIAPETVSEDEMVEVESKFDPARMEQEAIAAGRELSSVNQEDASTSPEVASEEAEVETKTERGSSDVGGPEDEEAKKAIEGVDATGENHVKEVSKGEIDHGDPHDEWDIDAIKKYDEKLKADNPDYKPQVELGNKKEESTEKINVLKNRIAEINREVQLGKKKVAEADIEVEALENSIYNLEDSSPVKLVEKSEVEVAPARIVEDLKPANDNSAVETGVKAGKVEDEQVTEKVDREKLKELHGIWRDKQAAYNEAYENYILNQQENSLWAKTKRAFSSKREELPEDLQALDAEYKTARRNYAGLLDKALQERQKERFEKGLFNKDGEQVGQQLEGDALKEKLSQGVESLRAGMAQRFVINAAEERLNIEKKSLPTATNRILGKIGGFLNKNKKLSAGLGLAATIGLGVATGGGLVTTLRAINKGAYLATGSQIPGLAMMTGNIGALVGNVLGRTIGEKNLSQKRSTLAGKESLSKKSYSLDSMNQMEADVLQAKRSVKTAENIKKAAIVGGSIAGAAVGAAAGSVDFDSLKETLSGNDLSDKVASAGVLGGGVGSGTGVLESVPKPDPEHLVDGYMTLDVDKHSPIVTPEAVDTGKGPDVLEFKKYTLDDIQDALNDKTPGFPKPDPVILHEGLPNVGPVPEPRPDFAQPYPYIEESMGDGSDLAPEAHGDIDVGANDNGIPIPEARPGGTLSEYTFHPGSKVDTASEALFETWKSHPEVMGDTHLSNREFLNRIWEVRNDMKLHPEKYTDVLKEMGVTSGDIDKVAVGQKINMQPYYELMNGTRDMANPSKVIEGATSVVGNADVVRVHNPANNNFVPASGRSGKSFWI